MRGFAGAYFNVQIGDLFELTDLYSLHTAIGKATLTRWWFGFHDPKGFPNGGPGPCDVRKKDLVLDSNGLKDPFACFLGTALRANGHASSNHSPHVYPQFYSQFLWRS